MIPNEQNISSIISREKAEVNPPKSGVFSAERMVVVGELVAQLRSDCLPCVLDCTSPAIRTVCVAHIGPLTGVTGYAILWKDGYVKSQTTQHWARCGKLRLDCLPDKISV